ncbi:tRNA (adenosine(37)-N6)-threonylcarbamoyltransferase complex ATPase subunit type 1 TsaE [Jiulongibacter sp. NS-SX5]|uniref:tRNA (adenosine(37)-N6)-threonylcarbamoyltransferase complex ATPase subunit type 1 TsaE n=1 Tax=Jiulongibacter sp. NS-SX5 TaxID=3463854 RepID=UPI004059DF93
MSEYNREYGLEETPEVARELIAFGSGVSPWRFEGNLGAGKTTMIKELCRQMGVIDEVQSPTFSIVNEYQTDKGNQIYHFDCYRLKNAEEALDFGIEEYLYGDSLSFIEWPQVIEDLLPIPQLLIEVEHVSADKRKVRASLIES